MPDIIETTDAAASTATTYSMGVGEIFQGNLGTSDEDWIAIDVVNGQTYTIGMVGTGALSVGVLDTYLELYNSGGTQVSFNDDGGPGLFSNLTFTATYTGTYYINATSYANSHEGQYSVSLTEGADAHYDVVMGAGVLYRPDASWSTTPGTGATVTWAIRTTGPAFDAQGNATAFIAPSAAQIAAIGSGLSMFSEVAGLDFQQVNPGGTSNSATMLFGAYSSTTDGAGAYAYYPGSTASGDVEGDVWLNNNSVSTTSLPTGSYSFFALIHEIGHAVGLAHPGDYNAAPGVNIEYATHAQFIEDSHQYTIMSYFDEDNTTSSYSSYPDTLMLYDIYALHQLYGANTSTRSGDTVYGFNSNAGGIYDFSTNTDPVMCIWDGNGTDTLDVSGWSMAQIIDLREGAFSSVGGLTDNLSIAIGAVIENAIGGSGADTLTGNAAANSLSGENGNDTLYGGAGNDALYGGAQNDTLFGGNGNDVLNGGMGRDLLRGNNGDDTLLGGNRDDTLYGGAGNDVLAAGNGDDFANGNQGEDLIRGGQGEDELHGGIDNDRILGGTQSDLMFGGDGDDRLIGRGGFDVFDGGAGNDIMQGGFNADDFIFADGFGQDTILDFEATNNAEDIDLSAVSSIVDWADLSANHLSSSGGNTIIDAGGGNTITLIGVNIADLDAADFIF